MRINLPPTIFMFPSRHLKKYCIHRLINPKPQTPQSRWFVFADICKIIPAAFASDKAKMLFFSCIFR
jgi:hypothetical protein